jgi:hypothetical protein
MSVSEPSLIDPAQNSLMMYFLGIIWALVLKLLQFNEIKCKITIVNNNCKMQISDVTKSDSLNCRGRNLQFNHLHMFLIQVIHVCTE